MKHKDLPQRWQDKIEKYLSEHGHEYNRKYKRFSAYDFSVNSHIKITFEDGSHAFFKYAFYWIEELWKEVAVFTEHCGYHIFNLGELLLETTDGNGNTTKTDDYRTE